MMKNAANLTLGPKEWLDRVIDNLDQLRILDRDLRPAEVHYTVLDVMDEDKPFPSLHLGPENVYYFSTLLGLPIKRILGKYDRPYVEVGITYRGHYIFGLEPVS